MTEYKETQFYAGCSIEEAMKILLREDWHQGPTRGRFNGVWLYSDEDSINSAYLKVTGQTQEEYRQHLLEENRKIEERKRQHMMDIPQLTARYKRLGHEILSEDKWDYWNEIVPIRLNDLYQGMELQNCLDIIITLQNTEDFELAKEEMDSQSHSGMSYSLVLQMVREFYEDGEEFFNYIKY